MASKSLYAAMAVLVVSAGVSEARPMPASRISALPVYTVGQAQAGGELYKAACAMCHGTHLEGTFDVPALRGRFVTNWGDAPLSQLSSYIRRAMPLMAPGTLSEEDTAALVAFLLQQNGGVEAGKTALPSSEAGLRRMVFPVVSVAARPRR
ncbi:c-type cytochrome [Acetobacter oeni]|uniref:Cytochrome c domain-containing protein n=1 Tax=Acetobacter oeni TaxID=304077 RepID=A0A511XL40_9PROT|nr:cytochrome c [Acetobacter oeni]MBB3883227.1 mono/diheme cytochrome c family protein [Acetobacter oeni]GBR07251.1 cytochrome c [Acetobacter oeni LMG 21952]GEN63624.1 hypothetical protein AOE01nite_18480 [Acetobacter oeni]